MDTLVVELLPKILKFLDEAGAYALEKQHTARRSVKVDNTLVTETDQAISKLAYDSFAEYYTQRDHLLIDEETVMHLGSPDEVLGKATYTWVLDPIDGTVPYAWGRSTWAVSMGILKDLKPWISAVYLPSTREMFIYDGVKAHWITDPFSRAEQKHDIGMVGSPDIDSETPVDLGSEIIDTVNWDSTCGKPSILLCAVSGYTRTLMGRGMGSIYLDCPWDFCGIWAIAQAAGLQFRHSETGEVIDRLNPDLLASNWKKKAPWILSTEKSFATLQKGLVKRYASKVA
jgi:fructose-1,6-bisphosphatase/inositol monophosphatase family enzyme